MQALALHSNPLYKHAASLVLGVGASLLGCEAQAGDRGFSTKAWPPKLAYESDNGFHIETQGRFRGDAVWINNDMQDYQDGLDVRQFRFGFKGGWGDDTRFKIEADFANDEMVATYIFVDHDFAEGWRGRAGYFKEPFGMERLNSSTAAFFPERASIAVLTPARNTGLMLTHFGEQWSLTGGVFTQIIEPGSSETNYAFTGRATYAPRLSEDESVRAHLGVAGSFRKMESVRFSVLPDTDITPVAAIDSTRLRDADYMSQAGLEAAFAWESVLVQSEYVVAAIDQKTAEDVTYDGWYVQAGWAITGERRGYSTANEAVFTKLKPAQNFEWNGAGWGAWEVAARISNLNLNDGITPRGEQTSITGGINWYPTDYWRFIASVSQVTTDENAAIPNDDPLVASMRVQLVF